MFFSNNDLGKLIQTATNGEPDLVTVTQDLTFGGIIVIEPKKRICSRIQIYVAEVDKRHLVVTAGWYEKGKYDERGNFKVTSGGAVGEGFNTLKFSFKLGHNPNGRLLYHVNGLEPDTYRDKVRKEVEDLS